MAIPAAAPFESPLLLGLGVPDAPEIEVFSGIVVSVREVVTVVGSAAGFVVDGAPTEADGDGEDCRLDVGAWTVTPMLASCAVFNNET